MNAIPIVGWLVSFVINVFLSIPFWFIWTVCGIGSNYFSFLPAPLQAPGFWAVVGMFICVEILRSVLFGLKTSSKSSNDRDD